MEEALDILTERLDLDIGRVVFVTLKGSLDSHSAGDVLRTLEGMLKEPAKGVVLDLASLDYMSSAGFGVIAGANRRVADGGGSLVIVGLPDKLKGVFDDLGLAKIVETADTRDAALEWIRSRAGD